MMLTMVMVTTSIDDDDDDDDDDAGMVHEKAEEDADDEIENRWWWWRWWWLLLLKMMIRAWFMKKKKMLMMTLKNDGDDVDEEKSWWWRRWWRRCFDDGRCLYWRCCDDGDGKNDIMTKYVGSNILGKQKPFAGPFGNWLCLSWWCQSWWLMVFVLLLVSWWSLNCVSVVVGILVALRRCVRQSWWCSVMFWVLLMFSWCFCGVLAVFQWCFGGIAETVIFWSKMVPRAIPNWHQRRCETLLLGLYAGWIYFCHTLGYMQVQRLAQTVHIESIPIPHLKRHSAHDDTVLSKMRSIIKGSWEAILPCYGFFKLMKGGARSNNTSCVNTSEKNWLWWRVVRDLTIHHVSIHQKRIDYDEGWCAM